MGSSPTFTSTCAAGTRSRIAFASAERSSAMRMRMAASSPMLRLFASPPGPGGPPPPPPPGARGPPLRPRHGGLRRREALAELDAGPEIVEAALDGPDDDEHVEIVEV